VYTVFLLTELIHQTVSVLLKQPGFPFISAYPDFFMIFKKIKKKKILFIYLTEGDTEREHKQGEWEREK